MPAHSCTNIVQDWGCVFTHLKRGSNWAFISTQKLHLLSHRAKYHTPPIKITDPTSIQTPLHTDSHQTHSLRNPIRSASSRPRACASHLPPQTLTVILSERTWQAPAAVYKYSKNVITHYSNTVYTPWPPLATARNDVDSESLQHFSWVLELYTRFGFMIQERKFLNSDERTGLRRPGLTRMSTVLLQLCLCTPRSVTETSLKTIYPNISHSLSFMDVQRGQKIAPTCTSRNTPNFNPYPCWFCDTHSIYLIFFLAHSQPINTSFWYFTMEPSPIKGRKF